MLVLIEVLLTTCSNAEAGELLMLLMLLILPMLTVADSEERLRRIVMASLMLVGLKERPGSSYVMLCCVCCDSL